MARHGSRDWLFEPAGRRISRQDLPDVPRRAERVGSQLCGAQELLGAILWRVRQLPPICQRWRIS